MLSVHKLGTVIQELEELQKVVFDLFFVEFFSFSENRSSPPGSYLSCMSLHSCNGIGTKSQPQRPFFYSLHTHKHTNVLTF